MMYRNLFCDITSTHCYLLDYHEATNIRLTSVKIGIMMIFIRISAAVRPSSTVPPRIGWKVLVLYLLLIGVTAFFVGMYVVGTMHTGLHQFYPR